MQTAVLRLNPHLITIGRAAMRSAGFLARLALVIPLALRLGWLEFCLRTIEYGHAGAAELIFERSALYSAMERGARETARVLVLQMFTDTWKRC